MSDVVELGDWKELSTDVWICWSVRDTQQGLLLKTPYDTKYVEDIKRKIYWTDREWIPDRKLWFVALQGTNRERDNSRSLAAMLWEYFDCLLPGLDAQGLPVVYEDETGNHLGDDEIDLSTDDGDPKILVCSYCQFRNTHQLKLTSCWRYSEDTAGDRVTTAPGFLQVEREVEDIDGRRDAMYLELDCESCGAISRLSIQQHKGDTQITYDVVKGPTRGPGSPGYEEEEED